MANPKQKAVQVVHLSDVHTDLPNVFWRLERRYWADGTSCLHAAKWGLQPKTGRFAPWFVPGQGPQYVQMPWEIAAVTLRAFLQAVEQHESTGPVLVQQTFSMEVR